MKRVLVLAAPFLRGGGCLHSLPISYVLGEGATIALTAFVRDALALVRDDAWLLLSLHN
jgi:hypothetical protein